MRLLGMQYRGTLYAVRCTLYAVRCTLYAFSLPEAEAKRVEAFSPTMFFLVLLPPIIFESGYNLHKGNFFQV